MIRPINFHFNQETAVNNYYQKNEDEAGIVDPNQLAQKEFDDFVTKLQSRGVEVIVVSDNDSADTPDSVFPNNWVSFHQSGEVGLYPMFAENRRKERRSDILDMLGEKYVLNEIQDFTGAEAENKFMEGTGSLVLDRENNIAYAAISVRTDRKVVDQFCDAFGYRAVCFDALQTVDGMRLPIYHTNVMMCVADRYAILCADTIDNETERKVVIQALETTGKEIVYITENQKHHFAGNMLQVGNKEGETFTVMSSAAYNSLDDQQIAQLKKYGDIIHSSLDTIEQLGGGSARCMMAEMFLPLKQN